MGEGWCAGGGGEETTSGERWGTRQGQGGGADAHSQLSQQGLLPRTVPTRQACEPDGFSGCPVEKSVGRPWNKASGRAKERSGGNNGFPQCPGVAELVWNSPGPSAIHMEPLLRCS